MDQKCFIILPKNKIFHDKQTNQHITIKKKTKMHILFHLKSTLLLNSLVQNLREIKQKTDAYLFFSPSIPVSKVDDKGF